MLSGSRSELSEVVSGTTNNYILFKNEDRTGTCFTPTVGHSTAFSSAPRLPYGYLSCSSFVNLTLQLTTLFSSTIKFAGKHLVSNSFIPRLGLIILICFVLANSSTARQ